MKSVLFGIESSDPITRSSAAGLLLIVALASSWIPARRAAHVHPMTRFDASDELGTNISPSDFGPSSSRRAK